MAETKKRKSKRTTRRRSGLRQKQKQVVNIRIGSKGGGQAPTTILDRAPAIIQTGGMRVEPDTNLSVLASRIDTLTNNQIALFNKTHQEAIDRIRAIKVSSKAIQASVNTQDRFAQTPPGQAPVTGEAELIGLGAPPTPSPTPINGNTGNQVTPIQLRFDTPNLSEVADAQVPTPRGLGSDGSPLTRKQLGGLKSHETVKAKGVKEYKEETRSKLRTSGVFMMGLDGPSETRVGTLSNQALPRTPGALDTPPSVASSSKL